VATFNDHEAQAQFPRLLDKVLEGDEVIITRNGLPVAELVPARTRGLLFGAGRHDSNIIPLRVRAGGKPMTVAEANRSIRPQCRAKLSMRAQLASDQREYRRS
jgi:prevent-host-death family protein